jgi:hypothetical protein
MTRTKNYLVIALLVSVVVAISACSMMIPPNRMASPAGRQERGGMQLVYESNMGVYVVSGYTEHYYYHGRYYRWNNDSWQASSNINRGWAKAPEKTVPPGLRKTHSRENGNNQH